MGNTIIKKENYTETGTLTPYIPGWTVEYARYGNIVTVFIHTTNSSFAAWSTIEVCYLPQALWPKVDTFGIITMSGYYNQKYGDGTPTILVNKNNGLISIGIRNLTSSEGFDGSVTYII